MGIRVLIKGMNKVVSFPAETKMEVIETSIKGNWANVEKMSGLPMDTASRMERAKFLGFDPDKEVYHGSKSVFAGSSAEKEARSLGIDVENEFNPTRGGTFFSEDPNVSEIFTNKGLDIEPSEYLIRGEKRFDARWEQMSPEKKEELKNIVSAQFDEEDIAEIAESVGDPDWDPFESYTDGELYLDAGRPFQNKVNESIKEKGYDSLIFPDSPGAGEIHDSQVIFDPKNIRSVNAEFNPANKESGNLLASAAPAAVGAGLLAGGSNKAEASTMDRMIPDEVALDFYKEVQGSNIGTMELGDFMGALDVVASLGSGLVGMSVGGITGILAGGDVGAIDAVSKGFQRDLVTDAGKKALTKLTKLLGPVESVHKFLVDISGEKAGNFAKKADPRLVAPVTEGVRALVDLVSPI